VTGVQTCALPIWFGLPQKKHLAPIKRVDELLAEMDRAGIAKALVWHITQRECYAVAGNDLLAKAIRRCDRLVGCWTILPPQCGEMPPARELFDRMARTNLRALRAFPSDHRYLLNRVTLAPLLDEAVRARVPLLLSVAKGAGWPEVYGLLAEFPGLTCIVCDHGCWGTDRQFRPLIERYPRVYVDMAAYLLDGGIEDFVEKCGPERMVFSTGFPDAYHGGMMLALRHAKVPEAAKRAIASGNLERILAEARL
jgi:predicted TIM-barrel fold metal-dependent hydrolase